MKLSGEWGETGGAGRASLKKFAVINHAVEMKDAREVFGAQPAMSSSASFAQLVFLS